MDNLVSASITNFWGDTLAPTGPKVEANTKHSYPSQVMPKSHGQAETTRELIGDVLAAIFSTSLSMDTYVTGISFPNGEIAVTIKRSSGEKETKVTFILILQFTLLYDSITIVTSAVTITGEFNLVAGGAGTEELFTEPITILNLEAIQPAFVPPGRTVLLGFSVVGFTFTPTVSDPEWNFGVFIVPTGAIAADGKKIDWRKANKGLATRIATTRNIKQRFPLAAR